MLFRLLTLPVSGPLAAGRLLLETLMEQAEQELYDEAAIKQQLSDLEQQFDDGMLTEQQFADQEAALLQRLLDARAYHRSRQGQ